MRGYIEHFYLEGKLGSGGFSQVYLGRHRLSREKVAVKVLRRTSYEDVGVRGGPFLLASLTLCIALALITIVPISA